MKLSLRDTLHLALCLPVLPGLALAIALFFFSSRYEATESSFPAVLTSAVEKIADAFPASMPAEYGDDDNGELSTIDDLSLEQSAVFAENNAYIVACSVLVFLGCLGFALLGAGERLHEPWWNSFLRIGTITSVALISFLLWGFYLAFPGDHFGILPRLHFGFPGELDPVEYGMGGISEWTDLLYIASYAALLGCLILSFCSAGQTATSAFLVAIPVTSIIFPLVLSWKWGGGWIDLLGNNVDFAGAALVHWHVGAVALVIGGALTLYTRSHPTPSASSRNPALCVAGGLGYFLGILGMNFGSTLVATPGAVAPVVQVTLTASAASGAIALIWGLASGRKTPVHFTIAGLVAGAVSVSGAADSFTLQQSLFCGVVAGILVSGTMVVLDSLNWVDPFSIAAVHGVGGLIGIFGACFASAEDLIVSVPGQLVLALTVPILSVVVAVLVTLFCGAIQLLIVKDGKKLTPPSLPPSLPRAS